MHKYFLNIYNFFFRYRLLGLGLILLYFCIVSFLAFKIDFEEDITKLIPSGEKQRTYKQILQNTEFSDKLILTISSKGQTVQPDSLISYAEDLNYILSGRLDRYIKKVQGKVPDADISSVYNFVYQNLPIFLNEEDYSEISKKLSRDSLKTELTKGYRRLLSPTGFITKNYFFKDPLNITPLGMHKLRELQVGDHFNIYKNYLITKDKKHIVLFLDPVHPASETNINEKFIEELNVDLKKLNNKYPDIEANYFGGVLYSLANANQIKSDIRLTIGIAVGILFLLLIAFYRKVYIPLLIFIPSLAGGLTAIAFLSLLYGSISAISLGIGAILLGISLDYALHILTHYRNNRDVGQLYLEVCKPVLMSSITTATAFLCLIFVNSEALIELGIFASIGVIFSSIFALIFIPLLYKPPVETIPGKTFLDKIASQDYSKSRLLVGLVLSIFVISLFIFRTVNFDNDLSKLNYEPAQLKERKERVEKISGRTEKNIYMVAYGGELDKALQNNNILYEKLKKYKNEGDIHSFSSVGGVILSTSEQNRRIEKWDSFWVDNRKKELQKELVDISGEFGFKAETFQPFYEQLDKDFDNIFLGDYNQAGGIYLNDFISEADNFATVTSNVNLDNSSADEFISKFENVPGIIALDRKAMNQSLLGGLKDEFNGLISISIFAVFIILLISYRNIEISLLTLLPIGITWICTLGLMVILSIDFNILNIIISTFIFGLGLDYSIFITNASLKEYETGESNLHTYQTSILLSVMTTLLGMGVLIFAEHPALRSVSVISVIGVLTAVLVSFVIQRKLFQKLILERVEHGKYPVSMKYIWENKIKKADSESERLYHTKSILSNYRFRQDYTSAARSLRISREKFLQVSRHLKAKDEIFIVNDNLSLLAHFLSYKFPTSKIGILDSGQQGQNIVRKTPKINSGKILIEKDLLENSEFQVFVICGTWNYSTDHLNLIYSKAKKVILIDSDFPERKLLDLNFEITYRQNKILVLQKLE